MTRFELSLPDRPRILIVRLSAIGDVIHAVPILCALRRSLPHAVITWVAEGHAGDLIEGHPALDRLVRLPRKWLKSPRTVWGLRRQLRELGCDVAIDIQGLTKSAVAAWLSGAAHRIGFGGVDGRELSPLLNNRLVTPTATHVIDRNLQLLEPLGIVNPAVSFDLPAKPVDTARMAAYLASAGLTSGLAVINPGAGWPSKQWPAARFGAVAQHLAAAHRLPSVVVWAGAAEKQLAQEVVATSAGHAQAAPPRPSRNWPRCCAARDCWSPPIPGLSTWPSPSGLPRSACSAPCPTSGMGLMGLHTLPCRKWYSKVAAGHGAARATRR